MFRVGIWPLPRKVIGGNIWVPGVQSTHDRQEEETQGPRNNTCAVRLQIKKILILSPARKQITITAVSD
jgi:hypothetical protein